ncbi:hypothetical protein QYF36_005086 [Acer negundo]|nr:hypothetical protein QYF36_005086 [Acer negundo]
MLAQSDIDRPKVLIKGEAYKEVIEEVSHCLAKTESLEKGFSEERVTTYKAKEQRKWLEDWGFSKKKRKDGACLSRKGVKDFSVGFEEIVSVLSSEASGLGNGRGVKWGVNCTKNVINGIKVKGSQNVAGAMLIEGLEVDEE